MTDLVSRLLEAIAAKEEKARAGGEERLRWEFGEFSESVTVENANDYVACGPYGGGIDADDGRFIADNDPSSVLRRCTADRRTVEEWLKQVENPFNGLSDDPPYFIVNLAEANGLEVTE